MTKKNDWKQKRWPLTVSLTSGLIGALLTIAYTNAGPIKIEEGNKTSNKIQYIAASYKNTPNALVALVIRPDSDKRDSPPVIVLVGQINAKVILPGHTDPVSADIMGYMYVTQEDLKEFPHPLKLINRSTIDGHLIDTKNTMAGLMTLRKVYAEAQGLSLDEPDREEKNPSK